jgi:hypothetical protein
VSEADYGKKLVEEMELDPFLAEYSSVTGRALVQVGRSERPDFVCWDCEREEIGLELVKVMFAGPVDTVIHLQEAVYRKEEKRREPDWLHPERNILVLQLMDVPIEEVASLLDTSILDELSGTGFLEIWVADYTVMEAFRTVQLFGIKPQEFRGLHNHRRSGTKPYG